MQVTETSAEGLSREYKVVIEAKELEEKLLDRLNGMKDQVQMKGFRPGKVPVSHLRRVHGKAIMGEVIQDSISKSTQGTLEERDLRAAMQPKIDLPDSIDEVVDGNSPLEFTISVELMPEFEPMDLAKIKLVREIAEPEDQKVDEALVEIATQQKIYEPRSTASKAKDSDQVTIDFVGRIDGEEFEGGKSEGFPLVLGSGQFIPGFEEQIVGVKVGDELVVKVEFPEEYQVAELAGKPAEFSVNVTSVAEPKTPEIDDELAKRLGIEDLDQLKLNIKGRLLEDMILHSRSKLKRQLLDVLDEAHDFELPIGMVDSEFDQVWQQVTSMSPEEGGEDIKETDQDKAEYRAIAERRVRLGLLLAELGNRNNITVTQDELGAAIQEQTRQYPGQEQQIYNFYQQNPGALEQVRAPIFEEKVVDFILEIASIDDKRVSVDELMQDPDEDVKAQPETKKKVASKKKSAAKKTTEKKAATKKAATKKTAAKKAPAKKAAKKKTTTKKVAK